MFPLDKRLELLAAGAPKSSAGLPLEVVAANRYYTHDSKPITTIMSELAVYRQLIGHGRLAVPNSATLGSRSAA